MSDWATETTQDQILQAIQKAHKLDKEQTKQVNDTLTKIKDDQGVATSKTRKAFSELTSGLKETAHSAMDSAAGFDKLTGPMKGFGKSLKESNAAFKLGAVGIGGFGAMLGRALAIYKENVDVIRTLNEHGVRLENSFMGIQDTLATTGMSLEQFGELSVKYARVIGQNGLTAFTNLITETEKAVGSFSRFGVTTAEATEYAAEYLQQQRLAGVFRQASQAEQSKALAENLRELNRFSKVLKVSRDEIAGQTTEMLGRDDMQRMFFTMAPEERKKAQESFRNISNMMGGMGEGGTALLELFTDMAASPIAETSDSFKTLAAYSPELAQEMLRLVDIQRQGGKVEFSHIQNLMKLAGANKDLIRSFAIAGGESEEAANLLAKLGMSAEEADAMLAKEREKYASEMGIAVKDIKDNDFVNWLGKADENAQGMANLEDGINKVSAAFNESVVGISNRLLEEFLGENGVANSTYQLGEAFKSGAQKIRDFTKGFMETDDLAGYLMTELKEVVTWIGEAIVAAINAGFAWLKGEPLNKAAETLDNPMSRGISRLFQSNAEKAANFSMLSQEEQFKRASIHAATPISVGPMGVAGPSRADVAGGKKEAVQQFYESRGLTLSDEQFRKLERAVQRGVSKSGDTLVGN